MLVKSFNFAQFYPPFPHKTKEHHLLKSFTNCILTRFSVCFRTAVGAIHNVIDRMCGKRVNGSAGYLNRNDHMLLGYVRIADSVVNFADVCICC